KDSIVKPTLFAALLAAGTLTAASSAFAGEDDVTSIIPSISAAGPGSTPVVAATPPMPVLAAPNAAPFSFGEAGVHSGIPAATQRGTIPVISRGATSTSPRG